MTDATRRRRWPFVLLAVLLALAVLLMPVFPRPAPPAGLRDRFDQIQDGMTEAQVEALLGGPRGIYDNSRPGRHTTSAGWGSGSSRLSWW